MLKVISTRRFLKEYAKAQTRRLDMKKLKAVMDTLINEEPLPARCRPHILSGDYDGLWECHIAPDWLLVYEIDHEARTITFERTGTHADLF